MEGLIIGYALLIHVFVQKRFEGAGKQQKAINLPGPFPKKS